MMPGSSTERPSNPKMPTNAQRTPSRPSKIPTIVSGSMAFSLSVLEVHPRRVRLQVHQRYAATSRPVGLLASFRGEAVDPLVGLGAGQIRERLADAVL